DALITPAAERDQLGPEIVEPELDEVVEPPRFSEDTYAELPGLLDLDPDAPQRLSGLLAAARAPEAAAVRDGQTVADLPLLVAIRVLAGAAQEIRPARVHGDTHVMIALDDGAVLDDPDFAGADLLVARAELLSAPKDDQADDPATDHRCQD